jgi:hypothetical protein
VHVSLPDGGVGRSGNFVDLERHIKEKRSLIRIQNNDDICCARALVTAKARIENSRCHFLNTGYSLDNVSN